MAGNLNGLFQKGANGMERLTPKGPQCLTSCGKKGAGAVVAIQRGHDVIRQTIPDGTFGPTQTATADRAAPLGWPTNSRRGRTLLSG